MLTPHAPDIAEDTRVHLNKSVLNFFSFLFDFAAINNLSIYGYSPGFTCTNISPFHRVIQCLCPLLLPFDESQLLSASNGDYTGRKWLPGKKPEKLNKKRSLPLNQLSITKLGWPAKQELSFPQEYDPPALG